MGERKPVKPVKKLKSKRHARMARRRVDWLFWMGAGVVVMGATTLVAASWPAIQTAASHQADQLVTLGRQEQGSQAQLRYRLARLLDPGNQAAATTVARQQLAAGQAKAALATLAPAGPGREVTELRLRAQVELGQLDAAAGNANQLLTQQPTPDDLVLVAVTYVFIDRPDLVQPVVARVSSPQARTRVTRAQSSDTALAYELAATGLVQASQRLLAQLPVSVPRNLLLAQLVAAKNTAAAHAEARDLYAVVLRLDPTRREAHQGLITAYAALGDSEAAARHTHLLEQLQAGRP